MDASCVEERGGDCGRTYSVGRLRTTAETFVIARDMDHADLGCLLKNQNE